MTSIWKNIFSKEETPPPDTDIYKDFNYKQIPDIDTLKEGLVDTSALDTDDHPEIQELNRNQVVIESTKEKKKAKKKKRGMKVPPEAIQNIEEIKKMVKDIDNKQKTMKGKNFDFDKMYQMVGLIFGFPAKVVDKTTDLMGALYVDFINKMQGENEISHNDKSYKELLNAGRKQIKNVFSIIIAFWLTMNWWYVFTNKHTYFSFAKLVNIAGVKIPLESILMFTNVVNYCLIGFKQDEGRIPFVRYMNDFLHEWRPIVFVIFFTILQSIYSKYNMAIEKKFTDAMSRKANDLSGANTGLFFLSFIKMDMFNSDRMMDRMAIFQNIIIVVFVILLKLLFVMALLPLGILILYIFLVFHSFFALPAFTGVSMFTELRRIFVDISSSVPDKKPGEPEPPSQTMWRLLMNMGPMVGLVIIIMSVLISNITLVSNVRANNSLKSSMTTMSIAVLFGALALGGIGIYNVFPPNYDTETQVDATAEDIKPE